MRSISPISTSWESTRGPDTIATIWGPNDKQRAAPADALLSSAQLAGADAGISRLADITRLDRVGLPVWQAIRPASRALSVHQGKGATLVDARLGALLEAVESDAAERFNEEGPVASWIALDAALRPADLTDFARDRAWQPSLEKDQRWALAERLDGNHLAVPFPSVSLDFTIEKDSVFERVSAGVATGTTAEDARRASLLELIERDAVSRFHASDYFERLEREIDTGTIGEGWYVYLHERLMSLGLALRLFVLPSPTAIPVIAAAISDRSKTALPYAGTVGYAANGDPRVALFQSVAEALQSRLTYIAGAREDCWPWEYTTPTGGIVSALAPPAVSAIDAIAFEGLEPAADDSIALAEALTRMGCCDIAFVELGQPHGFHIVRGFALGLGSLAKKPRL